MTTTAIQKLVNDLRTIEIECLGDQDADEKRAQLKADKALDAFQLSKRDLTNVLREVKEVHFSAACASICLLLDMAVLRY